MNRVFFLFVFLPVITGAQMAGFNPIIDYYSHMAAGAFTQADLKQLYIVNSDVITNSFIDAALTRGFIDESQKQIVSKRMNDMNRLGYRLDYGAGFRTPLKSKKYYLIGGLSAIEHFSACFNAEMFNLIFSGNSRFAGQSIQLHPFRSLYMTWEGLYGGLEFVMQDNLAFSASLSLLKGSGFQQILINKGVLFTSDSGDSLNFFSDMMVDFSRQGIKRINAWPGLGLTTDFSVVWLGTLNTLRLQLDVKDLGVIRWNHIDRYKKSGETVFTGLKIDDLFNTADTLFSAMNYDSIEALIGMNHLYVSQNVLTPFMVNLYTEKKITRIVSAGAGMQYLHSPGYIPRLYCNATLRFPWRIVLSPILAYGGFGRMDVGMGCYKMFSGHFIVGVESWFFEDLMAPGKTSGQGTGFMLSGLF